MIKSTVQKMLLCQAVLISNAYAMDKPKPKQFMKPITTCRDVKTFAGKVVAYQASTDYFNSPEKIRILDSEYNYGYVSSGSIQCVQKTGVGYTKGYGLTILSSQDANTQYDHKLTDDYIKEDTTLAMRIVNQQEAVAILDALEKGAAFCEDPEEEIHVRIFLRSHDFKMRR